MGAISKLMKQQGRYVRKAHTRPTPFVEKRDRRHRAPRLCALHRTTWQFLATHQPTPSTAISFLPRTQVHPSATRSSAAGAYYRRLGGSHALPMAMRPSSRLAVTAPLGHTVRSWARTPHSAVRGAQAEECSHTSTLEPVAHANERSCERCGHVLIL